MDSFILVFAEWFRTEGLRRDCSTLQGLQDLKRERTRSLHFAIELVTNELTHRNDHFVGDRVKDLVAFFLA
jgi:hypothetical protein